MSPRNTITVQGMKKPSDRYVPFIYLPKELARDAGIDKGSVLTVSSPGKGVIMLELQVVVPTPTEAAETKETTDTTENQGV